MFSFTNFEMHCAQVTVIGREHFKDLQADRLRANYFLKVVSTSVLISHVSFDQIFKRPIISTPSVPVFSKEIEPFIITPDDVNFKAPKSQHNLFLVNFGCTYPRLSNHFTYQFL